MPDILAHYALSYLVASRLLRPRHAALAALAGVAPDLDALLGVHRWLTHSVVPPLLAAVVAYAALRRSGRAAPAVLAAALYALHNALDTLTAPTPLLWPLTGDAYAISIGVEAVVSHGEIAVRVAVDAAASKAGAQHQGVAEGPLVATTGLVLAAAVLVAAAVGHIAGGRRKALK